MSKYGVVSAIKYGWRYKHYSEGDRLCADAGRQAGQGVLVLLGYIMEADEWRTVYDQPWDVTRARDLLIEFIGGEPSEQLRDQMSLICQRAIQARRLNPVGFAFGSSRRRGRSIRSRAVPAKLPARSGPAPLPIIPASGRLFSGPLSVMTSPRRSENGNDAADSKGVQVLRHYDHSDHREPYEPVGKGLPTYHRACSQRSPSLFG